tara:strand:+ start:1337 stop:1642 length:306 start_codon:yes stop_codon:yes gene_type:complete
MKRKKITYNQIMETCNALYNKLLEVEKAVNYNHTLTLAYIDCNKDQDKLTKFLKEMNKDGQSNKSNTNGNREDKSGNTNTDTKSTKVGKIIKDGANKDKTS